MSQKFREKMILSQFLVGLQPRIKAQMMIKNPETSEGAVELRERIEIAQEMLVPTVNVLESGNRVPDKELESMQASGETLAKTLDLVNMQLELLNSLMEKLRLKPN
ncbi:CCHC-type domain-containing protein [Caerostris extrusa]|uniref:CCHC-type domain-containing protein n=1 Tax=Caerostris extrusa TaxID=172846 RepID=A0AAV4QIX1_CAEEX|nr:CCHC-type domain-containing protein [Caerostris extrusa]